MNGRVTREGDRVNIIKYICICIYINIYTYIYMNISIDIEKAIDKS